MSGGIAIVERPEQLDHVPAGFEVVAGSPEVEAELAARGRPAVSFADFTNERRLQELGAASFEIVDRIVAAIDELVRRRVSDENVEPARWDYFWLKIAFDAVWLRLIELRGLIEARGPDAVAFFPGRAGDSHLISLDESVYGAVLPSLGVEARALRGGDPAPASAPKRGVDARELTRVASREGAAALRRVLKRTRGSALCLDFGYSVPAIGRSLTADGCRVDIWLGGPTSRTLGSLRRRSHAVEHRLEDAIGDLWLEVEASAEVRAQFVHEGVDLWPAASGFVRRLVERGFPQSVRRYEEGRAVVSELRPDVVLTSMAAYGTQRAACAAARAEGVPVAVARHGELGIREIPMTVREDVDVVDWALCWGGWERAWVERYSRREVRTKVVGAPMIEEALRSPLSRGAAREVAGLADADRVALFVPTNYSRNHWYGGWRMPTDPTYYREQTEVLASLLGVDGLDVVIKEHPASAHSALERWAEKFAPPGRVGVVRNPPFARLIHLADVVVIDAPSTTLVEALFGSARIVIVDNPAFRWEPGVREHLTSHGVVLCARDEVARHAAEPTGPYSYPREAREPLIAGGPGSAAGRAAAALAEIAATRRSARRP
ncbi:MAG: hypothetical protein ACJ77M_12870 [Thermoleophilaceae bacterium]